MTQERIAELAEALLDARDSQRQIAPLSDTERAFTMEDAKAIGLRIRSLRLATGEVPVGRKIGFTNRTIWEKYNITGPVWGDIWDSTLHLTDSGTATVPLPRLTEPRIEPEIVFGLSAPPEAAMDDAALLACIDWAAHGFEVVMSPYPGWRFVAPDCMAAFGLHGALYVGPRLPLAALGDDPVAVLSGLTCELWNGETRIGEGRGAYVLGGPVQALRFLLDALAADPSQPPLRAGDVVTTGTLLDGIEMQAGERWRSEIHGAPFETLDVTFT
ncbi:2-keto-4-pentenoate hydratase [Anianabacter salinae]|uniref:2-keto-4-pentenoate hydratase n=1 Tax=Anianabacter salinae TaxID=2851023 RepID=UPI00225E5444|nr:hypothetical protein [Anianabacter salinae]MBV0912749.1 hypothetical protein [Anianabacter salinae]